MSRRNDLDLILVALGSLLAVAMVVLELPVPLRLPVGIVAALVLPGYSVSMALIRPGEVDSIERSVLSFSLSLVVIVVAAPFLDLIPGGLNANAIVVAVSTITWLATAVAWWRRRGRPAAGQIRGIALPHRPWHGVDRRWAGAGLGLIAVVFAALLTLGLATPSPATTEFFMLGPDGTAAGLPERVAPGTPTTIILGIANRDDSAEAYRIIVEAGSARLAATSPISVESGATWTGTVDFIVPAPGNDLEIRVLLFRGSDAQPYRSLRLEVDAVAPS